MWPAVVPVLLVSPPFRGVSGQREDFPISLECIFAVHTHGRWAQTSCLSASHSQISWMPPLSWAAMEPVPRLLLGLRSFPVALTWANTPTICFGPGSPSFCRGNGRQGGQRSCLGHREIGTGEGWSLKPLCLLPQPLLGWMPVAREASHIAHRVHRFSLVSWLRAFVTCNRTEPVTGGSALHSQHRPTDKGDSFPFHDLLFTKQMDLEGRNTITMLTAASAEGTKGWP